MQITSIAYQKYIRQTPRKLRQVANTIRGQKVSQALNILDVTPQKAAGILKKVVVQAEANAVNTKEAKIETLVISDIQIEEGPMLKRWQPVSRGRAHSIEKRMSHIKITLSGNSRN